MKKILPLLLLSLFVACSPSGKKEHAKLLLVSFDGFRADYLQKTETPNFDTFVRTGVKSEGLIPVFPSKTFPNHYAIAVGLYPENNGLVGNSMYDSTLALSYSIGNREQVENPAWYLGEPIWNTVEKNGLKAGTMFWVGSEAPVQDMRPTHWKKYDGNMPDSARIDTVVKWLTSGDDKEVDFGTLYFSFVDSKGHRYGTESEEVIEAIQYADDLMGYLATRMKDEGLFGDTNVIILSDHGMTDLSKDRLVFVDDLIDMEEVDIIATSPVVMMNVKGDNVEEIYSALKENEDHYSVYTRENLPERFHLKNNDRVPEITMIADLGHTISTHQYVDSRSDYPSGGTHGFDNQEKEMHALFVAFGPDFKKGYSMDTFENIHIYELMTHLMGIPSAGTGGDLNEVKEMLR